ncbi:ROK family protein [Micromonospora sp. IBSANI012]|uniref:ROK family protein n=1 Tax=Micromonospora sp. IBSANI012 TaxID=3457761 RepID=UPI00405A3EDE
MLHPDQTPQAARPSNAVIGVDFGGTKIDVALAGTSGAVLEQRRLPTRASEGPDQAIDRVVQAVRELTEGAAQRGTTVVGQAAVCPGVIQEDRILLVPNLPGWEDLAISRRLAEALGVDSIPVWNDVRAGALAELVHGNLRGADPGVYLSLGTGIGSAVTIDGNVLAGAHQAAGEIGYVGIEMAPSSSAERAPLEEIVGGKALGERASRLLGEHIDAEVLFTRKDPEAQQILHHALGVLAAAVANIAVLLDPARVVVGGGMMASAAPVLSVLRAQLNRTVPFPPDVLAARFTKDASLHGAITLALRAAGCLPELLPDTSGAASCTTTTAADVPGDGPAASGAAPRHGLPGVDTDPPPGLNQATLTH